MAVKAVMTTVSTCMPTMQVTMQICHENCMHVNSIDNRNMLD